MAGYRSAFWLLKSLLVRTLAVVDRSILPIALWLELVANSF
ncbi:hypothetical protein [Tychonema sp. BBK16]